MPPRTYAVPEDFTPPPAIGSDTQDLLVIQDLMDTLDQLPMEITKVHSDLNELGAVLYCQSCPHQLAFPAFPLDRTNSLARGRADNWYPP